MATAKAMLLLLAAKSAAPSRPLRAEVECNLTGQWSGGVGRGPLIEVTQVGDAFTARAPCCWANATGTIRGNTITGTGGWTHDETTVWTVVIGSFEGGPPCSNLTTIADDKGDGRATWCLNALTPSTCAAPEAPPIDECPHGQAHTGNVSAEAFGSVYGVVDAVGVTLETDDAVMQRAHDHAITCEQKNTKDFLPDLHNVVEGAGYGNVWLETQPMAGAMWAARNLTQGLANQLVFMRTQRADGRLPGMVTTNAKRSSPGTALTAVYCYAGSHSLLQGQYFSQPAVDVAWFMNVTDPSSGEVSKYLTELSGVLQRFDGWLHAARASPPPYAGTFFLWGASDWGGDGSDVYTNYTPTFASMDMTAYAYSNAMALSRARRLLGDDAGAARWNATAAGYAAAFEASLWNTARSAAFDHETRRGGATVDVLTHNNLRAMWHGVFSQTMAEAFVAEHLRNPAEFWTPFPLPSIAANDPRFVPGNPRNDWSGPAEGLTYQRAIRALESYGFHAEVTMIGEFLTGAVNRSGTYPQQWNPLPFNGVPAGTAGGGDCYGPALLSQLAYTARAHGVTPRPSDGSLLWSDALPTDSAKRLATTSYTQRLGRHTYALHAAGSTFTGAVDGGAPVFTCTRGVRVVTSLDPGAAGGVAAVVGISTRPVDVVLSVTGAARVPAAVVVKGTVRPNAEYAVVGDRLVVTREVPFQPPRVG